MFGVLPVKKSLQNISLQEVSLKKLNLENLDTFCLQIKTFVLKISQIQDSSLINDILLVFTYFIEKRSKKNVFEKFLFFYF